MGERYYQFYDGTFVKARTFEEAKRMKILRINAEVENPYNWHPCAADEIEAKDQRIAELKMLLKSAFDEGFDYGTYRNFNNQILCPYTSWLHSDAHAALKGKTDG